MKPGHNEVQRGLGDRLAEGEKPPGVAHNYVRRREGFSVQCFFLRTTDGEDLGVKASWDTSRNTVYTGWTSRTLGAGQDRRRFGVTAISGHRVETAATRSKRTGARNSCQTYMCVWECLEPTHRHTCSSRTVVLSIRRFATVGFVKNVRKKETWF